MKSLVVNESRAGAESFPFKEHNKKKIIIIINEMESKKVMGGVIMYISSTMDSRSFGINHKSVCVTRTSGHFDSEDSKPDLQLFPLLFALGDCRTTGVVIIVVLLVAVSATAASIVALFDRD